MTESGPEPTGWELMRGLRDLRDEVSKVGGRVVSTEVYNADKQGVAERFMRVEARAKQLELDNAAKAQADATAKAERDKLRRQNQFVIAMAVVSMVLGVVGGLILRSIPL